VISLSQVSTKKPVGPANSSGYVGVRLHRPKHASHRWIARVTINGKDAAVPGRFDTPEEASAARTAFIAALAKTSVEAA
jgi:hypothetical protein